MAFFRKTDEQDVEPRLPRAHTPPWEMQDRASAQETENGEPPRRASFGVIVARVFFGLAVVGLLASAVSIALIWIYARNMSSLFVVLLIVAVIVTGSIAHALTDKIF